jgi:hypothetical protein
MSPALAPVLIQLNQVYSLPQYLIVIHFNMKRMFPSRLPTRTMKDILFCLRRDKTSVHLCLIIVMNSRSSSLCSHLKSHAASSVFVPKKFRKPASRIPPSTFYCLDIKTKFDIRMIIKQNKRPTYFN